MQLSDNNDFSAGLDSFQNQLPVVTYQGIPEFTCRPSPDGEPVIYAHIWIDNVMTKTSMVLSDAADIDRIVTMDAVYQRGGDR